MNNPILPDSACSRGDETRSLEPGDQLLHGQSASARVADLCWPEIEQRIKRGATAVLPIGAAAKEHGPHLPMATDYQQAEWLATRLIETCHVLVWPIISYGYYPAFADFPGSCSLSEVTFSKLITEVIDNIAVAGASTLLILNTGISTIPALERCAAAAGTKVPIHVANVYRGALYLEVEQAISEQPRGGHADEAETSIMLAIAPADVALDTARRWTPATMGAGKLVRGDPAHPNYAPDGVFGDPTLASKEKGERLLAAMLADLHALLNRIR
ncbi:MAG: creatininase family protein [Burkholderiales bacterium]|nr:creatininase family protein [Burkholderiales bacterium]